MCAEPDLRRTVFGHHADQRHIDNHSERDVGVVKISVSMGRLALGRGGRGWGQGGIAGYEA
jgi:hypothetical protein